MHLDVGLAGFAIFALYYVLLKALIQFVNLETRRNGWTVPAGVSGLLA
jgi:hypothetical protein